MANTPLSRGRRTLRKGGINWTWYLTFEWRGHGRGEAVILRHWRVHHSEPQPEASGWFELIEDMERTVCAISVEGMAVAVSNRKFIWDYKDET